MFAATALRLTDAMESFAKLMTTGFVRRALLFAKKHNVRGVVLALSAQLRHA